MVFTCCQTVTAEDESNWPCFLVSSLNTFHGWGFWPDSWKTAAQIWVAQFPGKKIWLNFVCLTPFPAFSHASLAIPWNAGDSAFHSSWKLQKPINFFLIRVFTATDQAKGTNANLFPNNQVCFMNKSALRKIFPSLGKGLGLEFCTCLRPNHALRTKWLF